MGPHRLPYHAVPFHRGGKEWEIHIFCLISVASKGMKLTPSVTEPSPAPAPSRVSDKGWSRFLRTASSCENLQDQRCHNPQGPVPVSDQSHGENYFPLRPVRIYHVVTSCTWVVAIPSIGTDWGMNGLRAALQRRTWVYRWTKNWT